MQSSFLFAENFSIRAKNISLEKEKELTIFRDEVVITTEENETIKGKYAEYDKKKGFIIIKDNITLVDKKNNITKTDYLEFDVLKKTLISKGSTEIITTENFLIKGGNILLDGKKNIIKSEEKTIIVDKEGNKIYLDNFEYLKENNIFKSIGFIKIEDISDNHYEFSQIYIDTNKKEILGTDVKAYMNDKQFKVNKKNKPRIFSNSIRLKDNKSIFDKNIFTMCDYRKNDKCPPWSIQSSKMIHDSKKKTIYYDNAVIKVYDLPIFYMPKLSHPDPTVNRRSGFLTPDFSDSKNLGPGISVPYFWAINKDKNFSLTNNLFIDQHPLIVGEFHQAFKNTNFLIDFGYTKGLKDKKKLKQTGDSDHLFTKIVKNFESSGGSKNTLNITTQHTSNDKYLELYKLKSNLVDYNKRTLENSLDFTHENENLFFGFNASIFETLDENYNDKYEYILPEITLEKNLFRNQNFGSLNLASNYKINKYDTNKLSNFLVNDFDWDIKEINFNSGIKSKIIGNFKNLVYNTKNLNEYKEETSNEFYGVLGYLTEINFIKENNLIQHLLKPKLLLRYSPGSMRKDNDGSRLNPVSAFNLNRVDNIYNFENGLNATVGLDYNIKKNDTELDFSVAQIINEKENKKMSSKTSLDEKLSDLVGSANLKLSDKIKLNYDFSLDQNYNNLNYNEIGTTINLGPINFGFDYLEERKHIGNKNYVKSKIEYNNIENRVLSFETKRNLITDSAEFYNLSYEYLNDCLRAGLVYRREFYNDSELEPENSLMFKITLTPFGNINSPSIDQ